MKPFTHLLLGSLALLLAATGCSHNKPAADQSADPAAADAAIGGLGSSDDGKAMGLETVHFAFDSNLLDKEARRLLKANAEILANKPGIHVQIEGHCDARGGIQYNIALGDRRADAVKRYLVDHGISAARLATISYGKERPLVQGDTEEAYAKNRRAAFVITAVNAPPGLAGR